MCIADSISALDILHFGNILCLSIAWMIFFKWDSLYARHVNSPTRHRVLRKETEKRLQDTENLSRKNLQLKDVC